MMKTERRTPATERKTYFVRNLPHIRPDGATFFITWRIHKAQGPLRDVERDVVADAFHFDAGKRYDLIAFVVMDDHVHVIVTMKPGLCLSKVLHTWKSITAHRLQRLHRRRGAVWCDESYDSVVRSFLGLARTTRYVLRNPYKRWPHLRSYRWVWLSAGASPAA